MTDKQKAKAYDEALERAQKVTRAGGDVAMVIVQDIFPELRESNEMIRKSLIEFLTVIKAISESGRTTWAVRKEDAEMCKSFIAYLEDTPGWSNKMYVVADLMPHKIRITNIRVERLQDICEEDCYREGIYKKTLCPPGDIDYFYHSEPRSKWEVYPSAREAFAGLIDKVSGKGTWQANPYCFCYTFELIR